MPYPPQFSSTLTYEHRYDLDEIDVFLEGDEVKQMFFSVTGLPDKLAFGKHFFHVSLLDSSKQPYRLRYNSRILFEFKSINNVILRSDVLKINQRNGVVTCYVDVLKDPLRTRKEVEDGFGTLTLVGSLEENNNNIPRIPEKFRNAMNYRCTFPIEIRKNLVNANSPVLLQSDHKLYTTNGFFSFVKGSISARRHSSGITYSGDGTVNKTNNDEDRVD